MANILEILKQYIGAYIKKAGLESIEKDEEALAKEYYEKLLANPDLTIEEFLGEYKE